MVFLNFAIWPVVICLKKGLIVMQTQEERGSFNDKRQVYRKLCIRAGGIKTEL